MNSLRHAGLLLVTGTRRSTGALQQSVRRQMCERHGGQTGPIRSSSLADLPLHHSSTEFYFTLATMPGEIIYKKCTRRHKLLHPTSTSLTDYCPHTDLSLNAKRQGYIMPLKRALLVAVQTAFYQLASTPPNKTPQKNRVDSDHPLYIRVAPFILKVSQCAHAL